MFGVSKSTIIVIVMILCILLQSNISNAATYPAGDGKGWGFNMNGWPNGKTFNAGDVIEFKYKVDEHNVVKVSQEEYDSCKTSGGQVFNSGDDQIPLEKGTSYFICTFGPHCSEGVKAAITAN
ncbi:plantacyanin precursor [Solanum lycopersicum]|uniref:Basic blue protein n=1 Tax=Solanum lycopersicum TaxID=4081 RepID=Q9M509_SOLLC|nr:plantacyanin precursor [Solanum lycopersicum]AAF66243.1 plantacyanin [Solanum lycopersicum]